MPCCPLATAARRGMERAQGGIGLAAWLTSSCLRVLLGLSGAELAPMATAWGGVRGESTSCHGPQPVMSQSVPITASIAEMRVALG